MSIHPNEYLIATGQSHGKEPEHAVRDVIIYVISHVISLDTVLNMS